jgi:hypothetical protein
LAFNEMLKKRFLFVFELHSIAVSSLHRTQLGKHRFFYWPNSKLTLQTIRNIVQHQARTWRDTYRAWHLA